VSIPSSSTAESCAGNDHPPATITCSAAGSTRSGGFGSPVDVSPPELDDASSLELDASTPELVDPSPLDPEPSEPLITAPVDVLATSVVDPPTPVVGPGVASPPPSLDAATLVVVPVVPDVPDVSAASPGEHATTITAINPALRPISPPILRRGTSTIARRSGPSPDNTGARALVNRRPVATRRGRHLR
jgi:hypothetical protein